MPHDVLLRPTYPMMNRFYIYRKGSRGVRLRYIEPACIRRTYTPGRITGYIIERAPRDPSKPLSERERKKHQSHLRRTRGRNSRSSTASIRARRRTAAKTRRNPKCTVTDDIKAQQPAKSVITSPASASVSQEKCQDTTVGDLHRNPVACGMSYAKAGPFDEIYSLMHVPEPPPCWAANKPADEQLYVQLPGLAAGLPSRRAEYAHTGSFETAGRPYPDLNITGCRPISPGLI